MKALLYLTIFLLFTSFIIPFEDELAKSFQVLSHHYSTIIKYSNFFRNDPKILSSIVAPEIFRYYKTKDLFETVVNRVVYIEKGSDYYNLSTGIFQMKPKFVEDIEAYIQKNKIILPVDISLDPMKYHLDTKTLRKIRLNRLESREWQITYLCVFYIVMDHKTSYLNLSDSKKVKIYSTAYNFGFNNDIRELERLSKLKLFPWGKKSIIKQSSYSELSLIFYKKFCRYLNI
jgi:hypothetical protein